MKNNLSIFLDLENIDAVFLHDDKFFDEINRWAISVGFIPSYRVGHTAYKHKIDYYLPLLKKSSYNVILTQLSGRDAADYSILHELKGQLFTYPKQAFLIVSGDRIFHEFIQNNPSDRSRIWVFSPNLKISAKIYRKFDAPNFLVWDGLSVINYWRWRCVGEDHVSIDLKIDDFCTKCDNILNPIFYCWHCENTTYSCNECNDMYKDKRPYRLS